MCSHVLLLPTTGMSLLLVGPGPLHDIAVSAFSRSPLGRADTFLFQFLLSTPRISLSDSPLSLFFLVLAFPFYYLFYICLVPAKLRYRQYQVPLLGSPLHPSIFLDYVIPSYSSSPYCHFLSYSIINNGCHLFSGVFFTLYFHFNFLTSLFVLSGYIPSSAPNTVLLVILEHPSIFLAAVICTVSSCFTNFACPSYTSPACSNFGTVTHQNTSFNPSVKVRVC